MGAAPDKGDTTAVTTGADTTTGRPTPRGPDHADTPLTAGYDTPVAPSDSGTSTGVDTTGGYANPSAGRSTDGWPANVPSETGAPSDSALTPSVDTTRLGK